MSNSPTDQTTPSQPDPVIGTPEVDVSVWDGQQSYSDTCAVRAQEYILEQFTGQEIDEDALVKEAVENGWLVQGGTAPQDVGNLLEMHGIPVNRYQDANVFHLANELAQGHKVIIGVDKDELWEMNAQLENIEEAAGTDPGADHAVVVSGIDTSDPNNVSVLVSDPGTGEASASYPLAQFLDAWQDSGFSMVATQQPAPAWLPEMANFDYEQGHIDEVVGVPYDDFVAYEDQPDALDQLVNQSVEDDEALDTTESDIVQEAGMPYDVVITEDPGNLEEPADDSSQVSVEQDAAGQFDEYDQAADGQADPNP